MSTTVEADDRGRIVISNETREKHGDRDYVVELDGRIVLLPLADDPVEGLRDAVGDAFDDRSIAEIKQEAREVARDAALNDGDARDSPCGDLKLIGSGVPPTRLVTVIQSVFVDPFPCFERD